MIGKVGVLGVGARGPYGLDALQTSMIWRSGKLTPTATTWKDKRGQTIGSVRARCLPDELVGVPRLVELAAPALAEAVRSAGDQARGVALLLATGEPKPGFQEAPSLDTVAQIAARAGVAFDRSRSVVVGLGHAGFALLLEKALELLQMPRSGPVIVGAVDSYHHPDCLAWLDEDCRLHADGAPDGIIPSEGAAFLVLGHDSGSLARLVSVAAALEEGGSGDAPDLGRGLCDVVRRAGAAASAKPVPWVLTDTNGERHRVRRWSFVRVREHTLVSPSATCVSDGPDEYGDAGAAMGALLAVHACVGFASGWAREFASAMVVLASESRERAAFVLEPGG